MKLAAYASSTPAATAASDDAKNGSMVKHDSVNADADDEEMKATLKALLKMDCLTLKSYARSVLMAAKTNDDNKKDEIKMIENQLLDLARAIQEAGELLLDLPLPLITTKICPFLPTRTDWNNFLLVKKSLQQFAKTAPISTFLPPWPPLPRPSKIVHLEHLQLDYTYIMSQDGQWLAFTESPPGMYSSHIHVFSRKNGYVANLCSEGPYPFDVIKFKQQKYEIITKSDGVVTLEDGCTITTDISGNMMATTTYIQAVDTYGIYLEWKLVPTRHDYTDEPKASEWVVPRYGADDDDSVAKISNFSDDGKYLLRLVGDNEIVVQNVSNKGKTALRYKSTKIKRVDHFVLSPNNKLLALAYKATTGSNNNNNNSSTIIEVVEILRRQTQSWTRHLIRGL